MKIQKTECSEDGRILAKSINARSSVSGIEYIEITETRYNKQNIQNRQVVVVKGGSRSSIGKSVLCLTAATFLCSSEIYCTEC